MGALKQCSFVHFSSIVDFSVCRKTLSGGFLGLNKFIFFVNYFYLQNKLFMLMAMFSKFYLVDLGSG